jgi:AraC-like DNA-binding protein
VDNWDCPRFVSPEVWKRGLYFSQVHRAIQYVQEHFDQALDLSIVATAACMVPTAFSKAFRRRTGITFREFIWSYRASQAARIMEASDRPIKDIAFDVGFGSVAAFERAFKRTAGLTPSEFRSRYIRTSHPPQNRKANNRRQVAN